MVGSIEKFPGDLKVIVVNAKPSGEAVTTLFPVTYSVGNLLGQSFKFVNDITGTETDEGTVVVNVNALPKVFTATKQFAIPAYEDGVSFKLIKLFLVSSAI
jgi:hypothetical protein